MRRGVFIVVLLCVTFACRDDTGARLSATEFIGDADRICARSHAKTRAVDAPRDESLSEIARVLEETLPIQEAALDALDDLEPPDGDEEAVDAYISKLRAALDDLEDAQEAAADDDRSAYKSAVERAEEQFPSIRRLARGLGLRACSDAE